MFLINSSLPIILYGIVQINLPVMGITLFSNSIIVNNFYTFTNEISFSLTIIVIDSFGGIDNAFFTPVTFYI